MLDANINISHLTKARYYVTHLQVDEINNTKEESRRLSLLGIFQAIRNEKMPTESGIFDTLRFNKSKFSEERTIQPTASFVLGVSAQDMTKFSDGNFYNLLLKDLNKINPKGKGNNIKDALIAETSIKNKFILVTADCALYAVVKKIGGDVLRWEEFLKCS